MTSDRRGGPKILWAPWRADYVQDRRADGCLFCEASSNGENPDSLIVWGNSSIFVIMNRFPYAPGHVMVCPRRHVSDLEGLSTEEATALMEGTRLAIRALSRTLSPEGFNVGINLGKVAGAGLAEHLHIHVVPRWTGDFNFMPVLSETRVISEHLLVTYRKLQKAFQDLQTESSP